MNCPTERNSLGAQLVGRRSRCETRHCDVPDAKTDAFHGEAVHLQQKL